MAIELSSEISTGVVDMGPRISFSQDFSQTGYEQMEKHPLRSNSSGSNSTLDFDFCVLESSDRESSSADELFSGGKIIPIAIKNKTPSFKRMNQSLPHPPLPQPIALRGNSKKFNKESIIKSNEAEEKQNSKSFWRFNRSSSCGSGYGHSLCPLPLLSRSNSTGSAPKQPPFSKQNVPKRPSHCSSSMSYQKPPLKKSYQVNPVLNVNSGNLFGFSSMLSIGKDKSKRK